MITTETQEKGFSELRSHMYEKAIRKYPQARANDIRAMQRHLSPKAGEYILGIGEGNGYFCKSILEAIGDKGRYIVTDPSFSQLENLSKRINARNLEVQVAGAEEIQVAPKSIDKIWSFGAFHHCPDQTRAMKKMYSALKVGSKLVICDVFAGGKLAKHFDESVAQYCFEGHEVKFLSKEFAQSLAYVVGFDESKIKIVDLPQRWVFDSEKDLGEFMYNLHGLTLLSGTKKEKIAQIVRGCKETLGITYHPSHIALHWPMKCLIAEK